MKFGDFTISLKRKEKIHPYLLRLNLSVEYIYSREALDVTHYWFLGWPEFGVPNEEGSIEAFDLLVKILVDFICDDQ